MELWLIFSLSFIVALSGALVPGPLLTYTIIKTIQSRKRGYLTGVWVICGHALLEAVLIIAMLLGFSIVLKHPLTMKIIGLLGGSFLIYMGISLIIDVIRKKIPDVFNVQESGIKKTSIVSIQSRLNPVLGGALVSMSNPYWWVWWAAVGFVFMLQYNISLNNWPALLVFFIGHEAGDLSWYWAVSMIVFIGKKHINHKVYLIVLFICGIAITAFGIFLGINPFLTVTTP